MQTSTIVSITVGTAVTGILGRQHEVSILRRADNMKHMLCTSIIKEETTQNLEKR